MHPLQIALDASVLLRIMELENCGGPSDDNFADARSCAQLIAEKGDVLLFGGERKGEAAEIFNKLVDAVAVLAFTPGGVYLFDTLYKATR